MKMGIIGLGHIARGMAYTIAHMREAEAYAVASRDYGKACAFRDEFGFAIAYGTYEELIRDPQVELVYIATPHAFHFVQARMCLEYGKHVLCEKTLTQYLWQAEDLFRLAKERGLFLMEARMVPFMPLAKKLHQLAVEDKVIGEVMNLTANYSYPLTHKERVMKQELAGGLMDIGIYLLEIARLVFGDKERKVDTDMVITDTGVDGQAVISLEYPGGKLASLLYSIYALSDKKAVICGTEGCIEVQDINHLQELSVYDQAGNCIGRYHKPEQISDLSHELAAVIRAIESGSTECEELPQKEIMRVLKLLVGRSAQ